MHEDVAGKVKEVFRLSGSNRTSPSSQSFTITSGLPMIISDAYQEIEGTIKYRLDFTLAPAADESILAELNAWRTLLFRLRLNGRDPGRYGGLAYGNVSRRFEGRRFLVSGSQTGGLERLTAEHYSWVKHFDVETNLLVAEGPIQPSSEALTHAAAYEAAPGVNCVLHVHSPELWCHASELAIPLTEPGIRYGTPEMAAAVCALLAEPTTRIIAMGGHQDGLIAAGATVPEAALLLVQKLAEAVRMI